MHKGIIKLFNSTAKYGYIVCDEIGDVFFHISEVKNELKTLLSVKRYKDEPIIFTIIPSQKKEGEYEARDVNIDLSIRKVGYIETKEGKYGSPTYQIRAHASEERYFLHHSNIINSNGRYISLDDNDPVIFSTEESGKSLKNAINVVLIDSRSYIESMVEFTDYNLALQDLAENISEQEDWDYIENKQYGFPILKSYINHTFKRVIAQDKLKEGKSSYGELYASTNTGLVDDFQNEIFAYFILNIKYSDSQPWGISTPKWKFLEFNTDQSRYYKYFSEPAEIATYFEEAEMEKLIFDTTLTIRPNWEHLLNRRSRVASEDIKNMSEQDFRDAIDDSISMAKKRIRRNYKTAIPHYYSGDIQFLVPLCERRHRGKTLAAMVIQKQEKIYVVSTILTLDQAYNNARLLAKPDREWLNP